MPATEEVPYTPAALKVADLNGDGFDDAVVAATSSGAGGGYFVVFLSAGDGTFLPGVQYNYLNHLTQFHLLDANGDGKTDLVWMTYSGRSLVVSLNNGDGTFGPSLLIGGDRAQGAASADVTGDGTADLIVANADLNELQVFSAQSDGGLADVQDVSTNLIPNETRYPTVVGSGDFNGDGLPDVLYYSGCGYNGIAFGTNSGVLAPAVFTDPTCGILNGIFPIELGIDGRTQWIRDIDYGASADGGHLEVDEFTDAGVVIVGTYLLDQYSPGGVVAVRDLSGDGQPDLVTSSNGGLVLYPQQPGGFGTAVPLTARDNLVALGDVNGDGLQDLVFASTSAARVSVILNSPSGLQTAARYGDFHRGTGPAATADLNHDGIEDAVVAGAEVTGGALAVYLGSGGGAFGAPSYLGGSGAATGLALADLNGDHNPDLVSAENLSADGGAEVGVRLGDGAGSFGALASFALAAPAGPLLVSDLNGDGHPDVVVRSGSQVAVLLGDGAGGLSAPHLSAGTLACDGLRTGDVNHDGLLDVACATGGGVDLLLGAPDGGFGGVTNVNVGLAFNGGGLAFDVAIGDVTGDANPDLVVGSDRGIVVLPGNGDGTFQAPLGTPSGAGTGSAPAARAPLQLFDWNGDGKLDALVSTPLSQVYLGDGAGHFGPGQAAATGVPNLLPPRDLNGDGLPDLIGTDFRGLAVGLGQCR